MDRIQLLLVVKIDLITLGVVVITNQGRSKTVAYDIFTQ